MVPLQQRRSSLQPQKAPVGPLLCTEHVMVETSNMQILLALVTDRHKNLVGQKETVGAGLTLVERLGRSPTFEVVILSGNNKGNQVRKKNK